MLPSATRERALEEQLVNEVLTPLDEQLYAEPENDQEEAVEPYDFAEQYWLKRPYFSEDFAAEVTERYGRHVDFWDKSARGQAVWAAYRQYHNLTGADDDPMTQLAAMGEEGELLALAIPHFRSLIRHQLALFTKDRPEWDAQARTADAASARQVPGCVNLLDYVASRGELDPRLQEQAELMLVTGEGYYVTGWDAMVGLGASGKDQPRGWFTERVFAPWEMVRERVRTYADTNWWIYRTYESRWDWVARFSETEPDKAKQIAELDLGKESYASKFYDFDREVEEDDRDRICVLNVVARPTKACPEGRCAKIASDDMVLEDGPYPFGDDVTISRMCASEFLGTSIAFSDSWSVLAPADAFNAILSMIISRCDVGGVPNYAVTEGTDIDYSDIARGNSVFKFQPGSEKPSVIDLLSIPEVLPALLGLLSAQMEQAVGINSVTRGQPAENVSSGSMAALLQSMAIEFNSNLERAWIQNLERVGTHHLRVFQRMATEPHAISVMGSDNRWTVQEMRAEDVGGIQQVVVKTASALSKTTAGRAEIAEKLLERGACTPQEYLKVIQTGKLEPLFSSPVGQLNGIKARSEKLKMGLPSPPNVWDNHQLCIREFRAILDTEVRDDPQLNAHVTKAIQEQFKLWTDLTLQSPDILAATGCPPLPMALQTGQQAQAMQNQAMPGAPPGAPPEMGPGPQQQKQPETDAPRGRPGPNPAPRGQEPSRTNPKQPTEPKPAKTPAGESVV